MALFITLGLISRTSAKMLSLAQHPDYAQHLSVYAVSCTVIWDEVPTMVEIPIFWFQIHITNGLNFMHRKWYTGNQYMAKYAENRMRSNLELLPVTKVKSRYILAQKISTLFWCTEWAWNWQIIFRFASIHGRACFNRWKEHPYIVLQYTPRSTQKEVKFRFQSSQGFTWFKY